MVAGHLPLRGIGVLVHLCLAVFSYLLGSLSSLKLVGVRRSRQFARRASLIHEIGLKRGTAVAGIDFAKGFLATLSGLLLAGWGGACLAALFVNVGTVFPVSASFQGMKNVSTAAGALLVLSPLFLLAGAGVFLTILFLTQYVSLAAVLSTVLILVLAVLFPPVWSVLLVILLLGAGILLLYLESVGRLVQGKEPAFPFRRLFR